MLLLVPVEVNERRLAGPALEVCCGFSKLVLDCGKLTNLYRF
jgi:hypothetical protein